MALIFTKRSPIKALILELALEQRKLLALVFGFNVLSALFEGSTLGILVLSAQILSPETTSNPDVQGRLGLLIDWLQTNLQPNTVFLLLLLLTVISQILRSGFQFVGVAASATLQFRLQGSLEVRCFRQMLTISHSDFNQYGIGRMLTYMADTKNAAFGVSILNQILSESLLLLIYSLVLFNLSWQGTLTALAILAVISIILRFVVHRIRLISQQLFTITTNLNQNLTEWINGLYLIRTFAQEKEAEQNFKTLTIQSRSATYKGKIWQSTFKPIVESLTIISLALFLLACYFVLNSQLGALLPQLLLFFFVMNRLSARVGIINKSRGDLASRIPSIGYLADFLKKEDKNYLLDQGYPFFDLKTDISFKSVTFRYPDADKDALETISFSIPSNKVTALVGFSGAGKSTIIDLILRLYDPTQGSIEVNNRNLKQLSLHQWRKRIGIVAQDTFIFNASIKDNIRFSKPDATDHDVVQAAKVAYAHDFILNLENQYDTVIGDRGYRLSGGQRQRLAIARAILRNPELLILDEATSSLDSESERFVQKAIDTLRGNTTILVVAHRFSTIRSADQILVLDQGKIVEQGKHQSLISERGVYAHLWKLQTQK